MHEIKDEILKVEHAPFKIKTIFHIHSSSCGRIHTFQGIDEEINRIFVEYYDVDTITNKCEFYTLSKI